MAITRRRCVPVRLGEPEVVPMSKEDHDQAVHVLAGMIVDWWEAGSQLSSSGDDRAGYRSDTRPDHTSSM